MVKIIRHKTIKSCLCDFFGCEKFDDIPKKGKWEWIEWDGKKKSKSQQESIKTILKRQVWGFVSGKKTIHVFIRKTASVKQVMALIAHELGHIERPYHRTLIEEKKANIYEKVAVDAYKITNRLIKRRNR